MMRGGKEMLYKKDLMCNLSIRDDETRSGPEGSVGDMSIPGTNLFLLWASASLSGHVGMMFRITN